jgi:hypothetical protein
LVVAGLVGLAVGTLVVGGAWLLSGSGSSASSDSQPITMPDRIGEFVPFDQVELNKSERAASSVTRIRSWNEQSSQRLSQSYGGTAAVVRLYADQALEDQLTVMVYRARSPYPQYVPYEDPAAMGLARPMNELQEFGDVSCSIRNDTTLAGGTPGPDSAHPVSCSRTNNALTVEIRPVGSAGQQPQQVAALVDEVWNAVS